MHLMRFYVDSSVSGAVARRLEQLGHHAETNVPDDLDTLSAAEVCRWMMKSGLQLVTANKALIAGIYEKTAVFQGVIIFLQEPAEDIASVFERYSALKPGRLYTLTARKVKVRQLPGVIV
jgi:hypothetical protein